MQFLLLPHPADSPPSHPASCNPLQPNDLRVNVYPFDRRTFMTNRRPVRREASPEPAPQESTTSSLPRVASGRCTNTVPYSFESRPMTGPPQPVAPLGEICEHQIGMTMKLNSGILLDGQVRIGSIVAIVSSTWCTIYTGGWSVCDDNNAGLGPSKQFYKCLSGDCIDRCQCVPTTIMVVKLRGC
ncbi:hypothetical protein FN846DRAFT_956295 [Sphaerosporella brunnea]|uniref:Cell wall mannoprotein PIR1-like C-terminal domain-containing protein n=1 Tax=Sphaerosporella brunnea TaxID=1250544 RepID=A0A5J5ESG3_9PEZI|nr:hypothetical protein FN846DRAFT_956295 [Sphaerosporella brunnea]